MIVLCVVPSASKLVGLALKPLTCAVKVFAVKVTVGVFPDDGVPPLTLALISAAPVLILRTVAVVKPLASVSAGVENITPPLTPVCVKVTARPLTGCP